MEKDNEITIAELIFLIERQIKYLWSKWTLILLFSLFTSSLFLVYHFFKPVTYTAELTYMINEEDGSTGIGSISSVLGQFGLSGSVKGKYNLDKIIELSKSRNITNKVLFQKLNVAEHNDYIANHIFNHHVIGSSHSINEEGFFDSLPSNNDLEKNTELKKIHHNLVGINASPFPIILHDYNENSGILTISATSYKQELAIGISKMMFEQLKQYYIEKTIEKQRQTYEVFKNKTDSLEAKLKETNFALLKFEDTSRNLTLKQYQARRLNLQAEATKLSAAYTEAFKSLQIAELTLENKTPFITLIDEAILPLTSNKGSFIKQGIIGFLIGGLLIAIYLLISKLYNNLKREVN